ncbi:MAG: Apolipoprotein N-acyltransferase / Copper homeostasis protein CutE [uncultured Sulfurovum sp.]|uniref:Apolipoprotein N-acyltransferase / Copper homeostasis protein CutE n=1 Tax=uncultured Sulfurovum sp. TaxID=269237 RepID=A0A6S6SLT7_9BACT|nr:MAG: Apolipoprotein N-acyltransferase / Copper homeostasis protein CutE [uncultured Sulfurovum sp.]
MLNRKFLWILSITFIALVGMRFNISLLAWVMFVPLLLLVRETKSKKSWFLIFALMQFSYFLQISKIITDPMPMVMALLFSVPMALGAWIVLWIFEKVRRRIGDTIGIFFFASMMSVLEWITYSTTEFGSWGSMTYTQLDDLAFLQLSSLFGITFGSFFIYLSSAFIAVFIVNKDTTPFIKPAIITSVIFLLFYSYGVIRVENGLSKGEHVLVAGISSNMQITPQKIPEKRYLQNGTNILIKKTKVAIDRGAKLIAWNEGATIIFKEDEDTFIEQVQIISSLNNVDLVIAYIVPVDGIKKFENKYLFISQGKILDEYFKYHPVPGEPAVKGTKFAKVASLEYANVSGAICYDFDFPVLGRELAKKEIDIAVVPSSDWRGIDPIHGQMAMVRAIEGGYSLLRPVRGATSYAFDGYGNIRASMNYFEENDRIMMASLPTRKIWTLYGVVGDIFPFFLTLFMVLIGIRFYVKKRN